jgi:phosphopantothenoylcysteine decarboxylase/phosphopantothenate--cysteine ligase
MTKKILLIITGSIAAYKSMDLLRLLKKKNFDVTCILTESAQQFITPLLASSLSGNKTHTEIFSDEDDATGIAHIQLSRQADLILIAPATADFIARIAQGYASDLASSVVLAANKKIILAPAMNEKMWENLQTQKNLEKLTESGVELIDPEADLLACGEIGVGKMAAVEKICEKVVDFFENQNRLEGLRVLVTGGSTIEPIDPVRFIGNHSSGKQAIEIVKALKEMGADVTMVAGNIREKIFLPKEKIILTKTAQEMFEAVRENIGGINVFIGCAAVADFRVKNFSDQKIKKNSSQNLTLELEKNPDILEFVGTSENRPDLVIGFAAESEEIEKHAHEKLQKKNCDLIVANDIESGKIFGSNETKVLFVEKDGVENLGKISKEKLAKLLAKKILRSRAKLASKQQ